MRLPMLNELLHRTLSLICMLLVSKDSYVPRTLITYDPPQGLLEPRTLTYSALGFATVKSEPQTFIHLYSLDVHDLLAYVNSVLAVCVCLTEKPFLCDL